MNHRDCCSYCCHKEGKFNNRLCSTVLLLLVGTKNAREQFFFLFTCISVTTTTASIAIKSI